MVCRSLTPDEVSHYREHGWVKLERFIDPAKAAELLAAAQSLVQTDAAVEDDGDYRLRDGIGGRVVNVGFWQDYHYAARDDRLEPFRSLAFSSEIGRVAEQVIGRDVPVQYLSDIIACKMPAGSPGGDATNWHQDLPTLPFDRIGVHGVWVALNEIPPERGSMRFLSGSQKEGPLGRDAFSRGIDLTEVYRDSLSQYELSPPLHMMPGDATIHHGNVVHSAPQNTTNEPRWAYILSYFPGDTLYTGAPHHSFDKMNLEPLQRIRHDRVPQVYP